MSDAKGTSAPPADLDEARRRRHAAREIDACPRCEEPVLVDQNFVALNHHVFHLRCALDRRTDEVERWGGDG